MPEAIATAMSDELPLPSSASASMEFAADCDKSNDPNLLSLEHSGWQISIVFNYKDMPDETRVFRYRSQLRDFVRRTNCKSLRFDLTGIKVLPSRMLGFFILLKNEGHDIELVNLAQGVQDIFRITRLGPLFRIRDSPF
jgi:hypothetical protein